MNDQIDIFHMASCARSGETMLLRVMASHPDVFVPLNVAASEDRDREELGRELSVYSPKSISRRNAILSKIDLGKATKILLKQGTWEHSHPFDGFILARNPAAVYASLRGYDTAPVPGFTGKIKSVLGMRTTTGSRETSLDRLVRWSRDVDDDLHGLIGNLDFDDAFCAFYSRRMGHLASLGLPVIHYERLVTHPGHEIGRICGIMGVPYQDSMLSSHEAFSPGTMGHGKNDLGRPVSKDSLLKYAKTVDRKKFDKISALTLPVTKSLGYRMEYGSEMLPG